MPVYNAGAYLHRAIDSIIIQTLSEWELIAIDDGSNDSSGQILDEFATQDNRIRVFHQNNTGVAMARQKGIDLAKGEYTIHIDADDWVDPFMLEDMYHKAKGDDSDILITDYYVNKYKIQKYVKQEIVDLSSRNILKQLFYSLHGNLWNKLIKLSCYSQYNLHFYSGINYCEDQLILVQLLKNEDIKVSYLPKAYYHYCDNLQSITRQYTIESYRQRLLLCCILKDILKNKGFDEVLQKNKYDIFKEGLINGILEYDEIKKGIKEYCIFLRKEHSLRWRIALSLYKIRLPKIAQILIRYKD